MGIAIRWKLLVLGLLGLWSTPGSAQDWEARLPGVATSERPAQAAADLVREWTDLPPATRAARLARLADTLYEAGHPEACASVLAEVGPLDAGASQELLDAAAYLAQLDYAIGEPERARRRQSVAVATARALGREDLVADLLQTRGYIDYALEDNAAAASAWREALSRYDAASEPRHADIVWLQSDLAEAERLLGRIAVAESLQVAAVERSRAHLPADRNHAVLLNNLGSLLWDQGRLGEAEVHLREAMELSEATDDSTRQALAHLNLGVVLREQDKLTAAQAELEAALDLARVAVPRDDPRHAYFLVDLAWLRVLQDRTREALPLLREARDLLESADRVREVYLARVLQILGEAAERSGDRDTAADAYARAVDLRDAALGEGHPGRAVSRIALARVRLAVDAADDRARPLLTAALETLASGSLVAAEAEAQALLATVQWREGDREAAFASMERAFDLADQARPWQGAAERSRARFLERFLTHGDTMIGWLVEAAEAERALLLAERFRARSLRERLAARDLDLHRGIPPQRLEPLLEAAAAGRARVGATRRALDTREAGTTGDDRAELVALRAELEDAARDLRDAEDRIRQLSPAWQSVSARTVDPARLAAIRRDALPEGSGLLYYRIGGDRGFGFHVPRTGPVTAFELREDGAPVGNRRLAELARGLDHPPGAEVATRGVGGLADPDAVGDLEGRLAGLFRILVPPPVWDAVRDLDELVIAVDGVLHAVPLEALEVAPGRYWLDEGPPLRTTLSLALLEAGPGRRAQGRVVSVSDARFSGDLSRLPGTAAETAAIVDAFGPDAVDILQGDAATEAALRAHLADARHLHLATHGVVEDDAAVRLASLALSPPRPGESGDGALHLFELDDLDLDCELAVLSACRTQAGERIGGEGVFALSRGFLAAGARRTVASLWSVSDASTAELMGRFFAGIADAERRGGPVPYAKLLRDAKRAVRAEARWSSPFHWAPFVLTGVH